MPFTVRAAHLHGHNARSIDESSPEAAAVAYLEDFAHHAPENGADVDDLTLIVRDQDTGREQCFRVDLATGGTQPCG